MAENKVQLIIEALDRTKGAFKEISRNLEGLRTAALSVAVNIARSPLHSLPLQRQSNRPPMQERNF